MTKGVEESSWHMFRDSTHSMKLKLRHMIASIHGTLETRVDSLFAVISQDHRNLFEQSQIAEDEAVAVDLSAFLRGVSTFHNERTAAQHQDDNIATVESVEDPASGEPRVKIQDPDFE